MSRPAREFTPDDASTLIVLASSGVPHRIIAEVLKTSETTLRARFPHELAEAKALCNCQVIQTAFRMATSGRVPAMTMFWLKTQAHWRETTHIEHSGEVGLRKLDLTKATEEELGIIERLARASDAE